MSKEMDKKDAGKIDEVAALKAQIAALEAKAVDNETVARMNAELAKKDAELAAALEKIDVANSSTDQAASTISALQAKLAGVEMGEVEEYDEKHDKQLKSGEWSEDKKKEMERVFRVVRFPKGIPYKPNFTTRMTQASVVDGIPVGAKAIAAAPTAALQYVLMAGAVDYVDQLKAYRILESKGLVREVNPKFKGTVWLPPHVLAAQKAKAEYEAWQKRLGSQL